MLFVNWGSLVIGLSIEQKVSYVSLLLFGLLGFIVGRLLEFNLIEQLSVFLLISPAIILMFKIFRFVFNNSPYIRARQRLFVLTVSFMFYAFFEAVAVSNMGIENFDRAAVFLLLTIPARVGITMSILLPARLTDALSKFIK
jgi:hypothetical protein